MTNILLIGHTGFYNRGCEAIVRGTVEIIKKNLPSSRITLFSNDSPDLDIEIIKKSELPVDQVIFGRLRGHQRPSLKWVWQTIDRRLFSGGMQFQDYLHRSHYKEADVVISIGGDNFSEDYGSPKDFFESLRYAKKLGKKTVIWGASIGPFEHDIDRWAAILRSCDLITAREDNTVAYLQSLRCTVNVRRVSDPAFCMPAKAKALADAPIIKKAGKITIGLGISDLIPRYGISRDRYSKIFAEFIGYIHREHDSNVVLVPHVIQPGGEYADDLRACSEVMKALPERGLCQVLPEHLDSTELKHCIAQCDYFIGARTHSTIASLSSQVPTGSIGYSVKAVGINMDLLGTEAYVLPHTKLSVEGLVELFEKMRTNRDAIMEKLKTEVPLAKARAMKAGEYLTDIMKGK